MRKLLKPGEKKIFKQCIMSSLSVTAICGDEDTPYIEIADKRKAISMMLTDYEANYLVETLKKALDILPTSK